MLKIVSSMILMLPLWAWGNAELFNVKSDKNSYVPHEKAILVTNVTTLPSSPNFEVVIKSEMNSLALETVKISEGQYIAKVEDVGGEGIVTFTSKYFMRDKYQANEYERAITVSDLKILDLIRERRGVGPLEREAIDAKIQIEEGRVSYYRSKLNGLLRLVESKNLLASVAEPIKSLESAFMFLTPDRETRIYQPGEIMTLFCHVYLQISDKEPVVKATMNGNPLEVEKLINDEFIIRSGKLGPVLEIKTVTVNLYLRDKRRSNRFVEAQVAISAEIARLNQELSVETDPVEIQILQQHLQKQTEIRSHVESILLSLEEQVEISSYKFAVEGV